MPLLKSISAPNGAQVSYHRVARVEGTFPSLVLAINGWASRDDFLLGLPSLFSHRVSYDGTELLTILETAVQADSRFAGAVVESGTGDGLAAAKTRKWVELLAYRSHLMAAPIQFDNSFYVDADLASLTDILGAILGMQTRQETTKSWRCADNVMRTVSLANLITIAASIDTRKQSLVDTTDTLWQQMLAATTEEQVAAIQWPV